MGIWFFWAQLSAGQNMNYIWKKNSLTWSWCHCRIEDSVTLFFRYGRSSKMPYQTAVTLSLRKPPVTVLEPLISSLFRSRSLWKQSLYDSSFEVRGARLWNKVREMWKMQICLTRLKAVCPFFLLWYTYRTNPRSLATKAAGPISWKTSRQGGGHLMTFVSTSIKST